MVISIGLRRRIGGYWRCCE